MESGVPRPFAELLRHHRLAARLTQEALAERSGISVKAVSALERGTRLRPYQVTIDRLARGLGLAAPQHDELAAAARRQPRRLPPPVPVPAELLRHRLPIPPTPLVGRAADLALAGELLAMPEVRLLTITGSPGVGKSRLGLELAHELVPGFPDGVRRVDLAALSDPARVGPAIQSALGVPDGGAPFEERLAEHLAGRRLLLLLDDFEHLLPAARLVAAVLARCPGLCLVVTSRTPLGVRGEQRLPLRPLQLPDPARRLEPEELGRVPAIDLFVRRARTAAPSFRLTASNAGAVAEICRRLDGLPLALELAAPWIGMLSPDALLARLDDRLSLLDRGPRDLPEHQRTLRGALQWSHDLLEPAERVLFRRLSVFRAGFDVAAAEAVCADAPGSAAEAGVLRGAVLPLLSQLVDRSLVVVEAEAGRPSRYRLLDSVRAYAGERLAGAEPADGLLARHARHHLELAEAARDAKRGAGRRDLAHRLEASHPDLRAAMGWYREHETASWVHMVDALDWFWTTYGDHLEEGRDDLLAVLEVVPAVSKERCLALHRLGFLAYWQGRHEDARDLLHRSLALAAELGDAKLTSQVTVTVGHVAVAAGDREAALAAYGEVLAGSPDDLLRANALVGKGELLLLGGEVVDARAALLRGLDLAAGVGELEVTARANAFLAVACYFEGDHVPARRYAGEGLCRYAEIGHWSGVASGLEEFAALAMVDEDGVRAMRLGGAAAALRRQITSPPGQGWQDTLTSLVMDPARAAAGDRADEAWAEGAVLSVDEAIAYALGDDPGG